VYRKFLRLISYAALSAGLAGSASAGCPVTGEEMDMMTAGGEAPCFAATPAASIASAGGAATPSGTAASAPQPKLGMLGHGDGAYEQIRDLLGAAFTTFGNFGSANPATGGGVAPDNLAGIGRIGSPLLHDAAVNPGQITSFNATTSDGEVRAILRPDQLGQ
jgi:hypothetical protein